MHFDFFLKKGLIFSEKAAEGSHIQPEKFEIFNEIPLFFISGSAGKIN